MKNTRSLTVKGIFSATIIYFFTQAGLVISPDDVEVFIQVAGGIIFLLSQAIAIFGRWRHGDITLFGKKK